MSGGYPVGADIEWAREHGAKVLVFPRPVGQEEICRQLQLMNDYLEVPLRQLSEP